MMMELEKQRSTRRSLDIQAALNDIMWKGSTNLLKDTGNKSSLTITPTNEAIFRHADNPTTTKYEWIVNDKLLDVAERPKTVPILPHNVGPSTRSGRYGNTSSTNMSSAIFSLKKSHSSKSLRVPMDMNRHRPAAGQGGSVASDLSMSTRLAPIFPGSRGSSPIRNRTGTISLDKPIQESSFKGYTPSGGRRTLGVASSQRLAMTEAMSPSNDTNGSGGWINGYSMPFYISISIYEFMIMYIYIYVCVCDVFL